VESSLFNCKDQVHSLIINYFTIYRHLSDIRYRESGYILLVLKLLLLFANFYWLNPNLFTGLMYFASTDLKDLE